MSTKLVILGGGFTAVAVARRALAGGFDVVATTRNEARVATLRSLGVAPLLLTQATAADALAHHVDSDTRVLVTFPPDGMTDAALAPRVAHAASIAYVSSTGVHGDASGRVDEDTPVDRRPPRAAARLDAERAWGDAGATVVRSPAIYGPGRGMHLRLARGELQIAADASNAISRIHVDDLAAALVALLLRPSSGDLFVIGDDLPAPQNEVVRWLCEAMQVPLPPEAPLDQIDDTLRHDRRVAPVRLRAALGLTPSFPTYREGFAQCLAADASAIDTALWARGLRQ